VGNLGFGRTLIFLWSSQRDGFSKGTHSFQRYDKQLAGQQRAEDPSASIS
jgi:hypothetical protein